MLATESEVNIDNSTPPIITSMLDPKRRNELIDEAFLEQKDMLLDMLETKLKEVHEKKKKTDRSGNINETCEAMPNNVDVVMKAHGISAIGDTDVHLKYGEDGNGTLSLDATGISNVGKVHVKLGIDDGNVHIPGLDNLFTGETLFKKGCNKNKESKIENISKNYSMLKTADIELRDEQTRRVNKDEKTLDVALATNETSDYVEKAEKNDIHNYNNNHLNDLDNKSSSHLTENITTAIPIETRSSAEVINDKISVPFLSF